MGYRFLQSRTILTSLTRFSLRRNNHRTPLASVVGNPRRFVTYTGFPNRYSLPWFVQGDFVDKYGTSSIPPVVRMMEEAEQQPPFDTSASYNGRVPDAQRKPAGDLKQDKDALYFKMDMPGVGKEDARVYLEGSTLIVKGVRKLDTKFEDEDEDEDDEISSKIYSTGISLTPTRRYNVAAIKAEMKNGVLKITVPKLKDEERQDVLHVQID